MDDSLTDPRTLLRHLEEQQGLVAINGRRTGSREMLVGSIIGSDDDQLALDEVDPKARSTGDTLVFELDDIISITWGDVDLAALAELLAGEDQAQEPLSPGAGDP